ncbi:hypothetical protein SAMN04488498_101402 [Mesorhizobium albiziae]|uniref:Uncharacterized protein n=1 Tax=Neomesorhizobium albiziae TaxID=335020 RepID=A0A1I3VEN1_9HYPH|nr:hypothetical protein GCM10007937_05670 [Mesorhizobium albiziae]SFJ93725.1 hypothetical protein SAMN04488498_101402 [Mesorhizobium albiziae]
MKKDQIKRGMTLTTSGCPAYVHGADQEATPLPVSSRAYGEALDRMKQSLIVLKSCTKKTKH